MAIYQAALKPAGARLARRPLPPKRFNQRICYCLTGFARERDALESLYGRANDLAATMKAILNRRALRV